VVEDPETAARTAAELGVPVALKASGPELVHKTELGGIRLNLRTGDEVREAFATMKQSLGPAMSGAVVQPMVKQGVELLVGFVVDAAFGPLVVFGMGGTAVELLGDHVSRLAPLTELDAREMVLGLRSSPLLTGYRGSEPVDIEALVDLILRMGQLAQDLPELVEADCNPVIATPGGALVVDARLRLSAEPRVQPDDAPHLG
jgi:acyl-CoA synthetase (NDP forming)